MSVAHGPRAFIAIVRESETANVLERSADCLVVARAAGNAYTAPTTDSDEHVVSLEAKVARLIAQATDEMDEEGIVRDRGGYDA